MGSCIGDMDLERDLEPILGNIESELREFYSKDSLMLDSIVFGKEYLMRFWNKRGDLREVLLIAFISFQIIFTRNHIFKVMPRSVFC
ncbi:hypothetical protein [Helicobacter sp.]|uniref:hypothetical protein n=1 Tax=Helicobacter sp. TaxID=218 RepID=UPI0019892047|nr:hypothetical protein [Helicobacter sp.]MBD5164480.1 hypothetical protein [Helicobacter sp.]